MYAATQIGRWQHDKWESVTSEMCREKAKEFDENIKFNEYVELYKELIKN